MVSLGMQLLYIPSTFMRIYLIVRLVHSLRPSLSSARTLRRTGLAYISMQVPTFPVLPIEDVDFVLYYVYFRDLYIPHRIARNMAPVVLGGKPIFLRRTNLEVGVYAVI
jgi:hypothetical protein